MRTALFTGRCRWTRHLLLVLLMLSASMRGWAQEVPPRPSPPRLVNDMAGMLRPDEIQALEQKLVAYNDSTSSQVAVVTVPTLGDYDIFDYAQKLYETWGIGQRGRNNGVLLLVAEKERRARIHTGYGLEGAIPDALAKRIISNTIVPAFREQRYYEGIDRATDQLFALAKGEYKADQTVPQGRSRADDDSGSGWMFWLIIGLLILFILMRKGGGGGGGYGRRNRGFGGGMLPPIIFGDFSGGRGVFGGGGGSWGGGGGGGFGGFGGGSSGGGGASGDW